jgi:hypothetical protein
MRSVCIALTITLLSGVSFQLNPVCRSGSSTYKPLAIDLVQSAMAQETPDAVVEEDDLTPQSQGGGESKSSQPAKKDSKPKELKRPITQIIDTSIEEKPAESQPFILNEKSDQYKERESRLAEPLRKLVQAPFLFNNAKGGSSELTDAFLAAAKEGPTLKDDLQFVIENGSPAGKVYAAALIRLFDAPSGTRILTGFKSDKTLVENKSYISLEHYTTGEVATDLLSPKPTILLRPR